MKITTSITYSCKNILFNYLKITIGNKILYKLWMLYYDRIDGSEGNGVNKTS